MKVTAELTRFGTRVRGVPTRIWTARTDRGVPCLLFMVRIATYPSGEIAQLDADLRETEPAQEITEQEAFNLLVVS